MSAGGSAYVNEWAYTDMAHKYGGTDMGDRHEGQDIGDREGARGVRV